MSLDSRSMLVGELTIWENLAIQWKTKGLPQRMSSGKIKKMLSLFLSDYEQPFDINRKAESLTPMECLRLEILASRLRKAKLVLIDGIGLEWTTQEFESLRSLMKKLCGEGLTFLYFSHQMKILPLLTDRIAFLYEGRIVKIIEKDRHYEQTAYRVMANLYGINEHMDRDVQMESEPVLKIKDLGVGQHIRLNATLYKGECTAIVVPHLEAFSAMQRRFFEEKPMDACELWYEGEWRSHIRENAGVVFLNTANLDRLIEEMTPEENLCLGFYDKLSVAGFQRTNRLECLKSDFYKWYGKEGLLEKKDSAQLYRKDRIAINLFRLQLMHAKVLILNDFSIHNDLVTYQMVKRSLAELLERGTAIGIVTGDVSMEDKLVDRYVYLLQDLERN